MLIKFTGNLDKKLTPYSSQYNVIDVYIPEDNPAIKLYRVFPNDEGGITDIERKEFEVVEITSEVIDTICDGTDRVVWGYDIYTTQHGMVLEKDNGVLHVYTAINLYHTNDIGFESIISSLKTLGYKKATEIDFKNYNL